MNCCDYLTLHEIAKHSCSSIEVTTTPLVEPLPIHKQNDFIVTTIVIEQSWSVSKDRLPSCLMVADLFDQSHSFRPQTSPRHYLSAQPALRHSLGQIHHSLARPRETAQGRRRFIRTSHRRRVHLQAGQCEHLVRLKHPQHNMLHNHAKMVPRCHQTIQYLDSIRHACGKCAKVFKCSIETMTARSGVTMSQRCSKTSVSLRRRRRLTYALDVDTIRT